MKDYYRIEKNFLGTRYYNEKGNPHRLISAAILFDNGSKAYYINGIGYMFYDKNDNELCVYLGILELNFKYEEYIKQNIKDLISEYNPKIILDSDFYTKKEN